MTGQTVLGIWDGHDSGAALVDLVDELHSTLVRHFSHEQFPGGLYERMGAYGPEHHGRIRVLVGDHCSILARAGALLERARRSGPAEEADLRADAAALAEAVREHERREHDLAHRLLDAPAPHGASAAR